MFKVKQKLKWCKHSFIKWRKEKNHNSRKEIDIIQEKGNNHNSREMEHMQHQGGDMNWDRWRQLKESLEAAYK